MLKANQRNREDLGHAPGLFWELMAKVFGSMGGCRIAIEVSTHSPWASRLLRAFGHEVVVANTRQVK